MSDKEAEEKEVKEAETEEGAEGIEGAEENEANNLKDINLKAVYDIPVDISAVLGTTSMPISELVKLGRGTVIKLDRKVGESVDIYVNDRIVAKGEVVIIENRIGVTLTEIVKSVDHD